MLDGILEIAIAEPRGVICHFIATAEPCLDPVEIEGNDPRLPNLSDDRWAPHYVSSEPPFVAVRVAFNRPDNASHWSTTFGKWDIHVLFERDWINGNRAEWAEIQRAIFLELADRDESLETAAGREEAATAIRSLISQMPTVPLGDTLRSILYLVISGKPEYEPVIFSSQRTEYSLGEATALIIMVRALREDESSLFRLFEGDLDDDITASDDSCAEAILTHLAERRYVLASFDGVAVILFRTLGNMLALEIRVPFPSFTGESFFEVEKNYMLDEAQDLVIADAIGIEREDFCIRVWPEELGLRPILKTYLISPAEGEIASDYFDRAKWWSLPRHETETEWEDLACLWLSSHDGMEWHCGEPEELWVVGAGATCLGEAAAIVEEVFQSRVLLGTQRWLDDEVARLKASAQDVRRTMAGGEPDDGSPSTRSPAGKRPFG